MEIKIKDKIIDIDFIDNNSKNTLLCIHGFDSNKSFIKTLGKENSNFNIVSYTVPIIENMTIEYMLEISRLVLNKIKNSKVYLLGHSLGGAIVSKMQSNKIKGTFYASSIHPFLTKTKTYKLLQAAINPQNQVESFIGSLALATAKKIKMSEKFVDENSPWFSIVKKSIIRKEFMEKLDKEIKSTKNSFFIVGDNDQIISTKYFTDYVENELDSLIKIVQGGHNVFDNKIVQKYLNTKIIFKKRFLSKWRQIL